MTALHTELASVLGGPPPREALDAVRRDLDLDPLPQQRSRPRAS
ncbi:MAG TPA: hypothetical protein VLJ59_13325 [Mycobacteriales bacterium]|nr:hypothetical protein [Mycobacteriales bacterium]